MAAVVDAACMSTKSSRVGKEERMMDKQRLREERHTGVVYEKAMCKKNNKIKLDIQRKQVERRERGQSHLGAWVAGF